MRNDDYLILGEKMNEQKSHKGIKILFILILIIFCFYLYGRYINPIGFKVHEVAIKDKQLPQDYHGLKIVQFSDIHYGRTTNEETLKKIVKNINDLNPDIIIFNGDLFDKKNITTKEEELMINYLKKINAKLFKFAVIGDYDQKNLNTYKAIIEKSNFILLDNTSKLVYYESSTPINFIGLTNTDNIKELYDNDYFNITIMHKPDQVAKLKNTRIAFAGHSLGGQFKIPFIGGIKKIEGANTYIESYYKVNNTKLYITNGLGTQDISLRFFNTPSITLYRIYNH